MEKTRLESLAAIEAAVWRELAAAAHGAGAPAHGWRRCVLATRASNDDEGADARVVILRELDAATRTLFFYTDARSGKVAQIAALPMGTLVAWCPQLAWQVRLRVALEVHSDGLAVSSHWARLALTPAAMDYLAPAAPGTLLAPPAWSDPAFVPPPAGRTHFALVSAQVRSIDWLELGETKHRRASFDAAGARWLVP